MEPTVRGGHCFIAAKTLYAGGVEEIPKAVARRDREEWKAVQSFNALKPGPARRPRRTL
jgi:hypothetical protein